MSEAERLRAEYESSLSWRITKPLRSLKRRTLDLQPAAAPFTAGRFDSWLEHYHGERLRQIDTACRPAEPESFALFRGLDTDLWTMLLSQEYTLYPRIRALLPELPEPGLQELWNGASGERLANQSKTFYEKVLSRYAEHGGGALSPTCRVLDFGCGWGRLTRFFARDIEPGGLHGCDPVQQILDVCARTRVPATLTRTPFVPERLPYESFDLAYSFSVFTHISEPAANACIGALHAALRPGGILVLTLRPPQYVQFSKELETARAALGNAPAAALNEPRYVFAAHPAEESHLQYEGGEMTYGEAVITLPYVRTRWASMFELVEADVLIGDLYQVMLTLRRR